MRHRDKCYLLTALFINLFSGCAELISIRGSLTWRLD